MNTAASMAMAPLPAYRSHKKVWALKIANVETTATEDIRVYYEDKTFAPAEFNLHGKPRPESGWYMVQYEDGYVSFSPAKQFEDGYALIKPGDNPHGGWHGIGWAIKHMQDGLRVRRAGWNGKGMWLGFVPANQWGLGSGQNAFDYGAAGPGKLLPWIGMRIAQGDFVPWLASQTDLLAIDWELAE